MLILGIDPGLTTGWCVLHYNEESKVFTPVDGGAAQGFMATMDTLVGKFHKYAVDAAVVETFMLLPHMATQVSINDPHMNSSQLQGALVYALPPNRLFLQRPSQKTAVPDEEIRKAGLWRWKGASMADLQNYRHFHDAVRHAMLHAWSQEKRRRR
jgi:hypothetical protein